MTTQELKQYIDKVLGNSIRCLLPSYWWKRLFSLTLEKVDEKLDATNIKTINGESIVGEGDLRVGVKSVESVEALEKLDAVVGDIATVGASVPIQVKIADCYYSVDFEKDWDKYTAITRVEEIGLISDTEERAVNLYKFKDGRYVSTIIIGTENGYRVYKISKNDTYEDISLEEINGILAKNEYRFGIGYRWADIDSFFRFYTNSVSADAYIKSDSWDKLSKEYVVSSEEELNALSVENGIIAKVAKWQYGEVDPYQCYSITNESSHDDDTIKRIWDKLTRISHIDITYPETPPTVMPAWPTILLHGYASTSDDVIQITYYQESYKIGVGNSGSINIVSIDKMNTILQEKDYRLIDLTNDKYARPFIEEHITFYSPNANITADAYIKGETWTRLLKDGDVTGGGADITIDSELSDTSTNAIQNKVVANALNEKADASSLEESNQEIMGVIEAVSLDIGEMIGAANLSINELYNTKQDKISDIETIRSGAAKGTTALQEHQDISHLASKEELQNLQNEVIANEEVVAAAINDLNARIGAAADTTYVDNAIANAITATLNTAV